MYALSTAYSLSGLCCFQSEFIISLNCGGHVEDQHPDKPEAVDKCGGGADEEGWQALRDRLLQEQGENAQ